MWDCLWVNARIATMTAGAGPYGRIDHGAIAVEAGRIAWVGSMTELPGAPAREVHDAAGRWILPGLVDCHTHLVWAGTRAREFELRLQGATYEQIARGGGGIVSTVRHTRAASEAHLVTAAERRLARLMAEGVTTVEIKSGYGLDLATERKILRVARRLGETLPVTVRTTFLGAHAVPPELVGRADEYVQLVCDEMLPEIAAEGLADAVDVFCECIGFTPQQTRRVLERARALGLPVKVHADQLAESGGTALAAEFDALSADHLEYASEDGVVRMAAAGTVAVMLPVAFYVLREKQAPPVASLRRQGVPMAVATDCNPGTAPCTSLLLALNLACTLFRLTPEEALAGVTRCAARALGMEATHGTLETGKQGDLTLWDIDEPAELCYQVGAAPPATVVRNGAVRHLPAVSAAGA